jgi:branched-chain amino acid transport system ATP-binding protein
MTMLDVSNINSYYDTSHVLHDVSLAVDEGALVTLIGRNGAGKTTTLKSIIGIVQPRSGSITFDGEDITGLAPHQIAKRGIAYIPEHRELFPNSRCAKTFDSATWVTASPTRRRTG